jgi:hypothetical protein
MLPSKWRQDLSVEVSRSVANWSKEVKEETKNVNYGSLTFEKYKARVPAEKYISAEDINVHFFLVEKLGSYLVLLGREVICILLCRTILMQRKALPQANP